MPYCSILECKNDSRRKTLSKGGVSYHRFPKEATIKEKWIDATGRVNWMPTKNNTVCSDHFLKHEFMISFKGYRYPKSRAVPTLKIVKYFSQSKREETSSENEDLDEPAEVNISATDVNNVRVKTEYNYDISDTNDTAIPSVSNIDNTLKREERTSENEDNISAIDVNNVRVKTEYNNEMSDINETAIPSVSKIDYMGLLVPSSKKTFEKPSTSFFGHESEKSPVTSIRTRSLLDTSHLKKISKRNLALTRYVRLYKNQILLKNKEIHNLKQVIEQLKKKNITLQNELSILNKRK